MISVQHWDAAAKTCRACTVESLPASAAAVADGDVWWVDLTDPTPDEEQLIFGKFFPVHSLTREDITRVRTAEDKGSHLPKVEEFPDYLFVIVNPLPPGLVELLKSVQRGAPAPRAAMLARKNRPQLSAVL